MNDKIITVILIPILLLAACSTIGGKEPNMTTTEFVQQYIALNGPAIGDSEQVLFVTATTASSTVAVIRMVEKASGEWRLAAVPINGNIGRNGFAPPGGKREGDGRTPSGVFRLGTAFGYQPVISTRMPYRQATTDDFWVDDAGSPSYNKWVTGRPDAVSFERMKRDDDLYKYGIVIEYNTDPVVKGRGSAIFLHVWRGEGKPTEGCVSVSEGSVVALLTWLDPARKPIAVMGSEALLF